MENRYVINYDIKHRCITNAKFKQGDVDSSILEVHLKDNGIATDITGEVIEFRFLLSGNIICFQDSTAGVTITDATNGVVECVLKSDALAVAGIVKCDIHRVKDGKQLTVPSFYFTVESSIDGNGAAAQNYISALDNYEMTIAGFSSQLAANANEKKNKTTIKRKAFVTVMDDDGNVAFFDNGHYAKLKLHPNAKMSLAVCGIQLGGGNASYFTDAQIETLKADSQIEFVNHGWNGEKLNMAEAELQTEYDAEKAKFIEYGLSNYDYYTYGGYTYPDCVSNGALKNRLSKFYKCSLANVGSQEAYIPFESMEVKRMSAYGGQSTKDYIDFCIENDCWCVIFGHAWMTGQTDSAILDDILTYIDGKVSEGLIEYATVKDMIDNYGNVVEIGNGIAGADKFILGKNGGVNFNIQGKNINELYRDVEALQLSYTYSDTAFVANKPLSDYPEQSITVEPLLYADAIKMGLPDGGIVKTTRYKKDGLVNIDTYHIQELYQLSTSNIWLRGWRTQKGSNVWFPWAPLNSVSMATRPIYANLGTNIYDTTLNKPIWCKTKGVTPNKILARSTAYNYGDIVVYAGFNVMCITAGATSDTQPAVNADAAFVDGTVTWLYMGVASAWVDATGTTV